jgi:hypothetical protein
MGKKAGFSLTEQDHFEPILQPSSKTVDVAELCANATPGGSERK